MEVLWLSSRVHDGYRQMRVSQLRSRPAKLWSLKMETGWPRSGGIKSVSYDTGRVGTVFYITFPFDMPRPTRGLGGGIFRRPRKVRVHRSSLPASLRLLLHAVHPHDSSRRSRKSVSFSISAFIPFSWRLHFPSFVPSIWLSPDGRMLGSARQRKSAIGQCQRPSV
jgi:hypothetical protein